MFLFKFSFLLDKNLGGLVMEAPFMNIHQALLTHWFSLVNIVFFFGGEFSFIKNSFSFFVGNHGIIV